MESPAFLLRIGTVKFDVPGNSLHTILQGVDEEVIMVVSSGLVLVVVIAVRLDYICIYWEVFSTSP